ALSILITQLAEVFGPACAEHAPEDGEFVGAHKRTLTPVAVFFKPASEVELGVARARLVVAEPRGGRGERGPRALAVDPPNPRLGRGDGRRPTRGTGWRTR